MRRPIVIEEHAVELLTAMRMVDQARESLVRRPLSDTDIAWAKGSLDRGSEALEAILKNVPGPRAAA